MQRREHIGDPLSFEDIQSENVEAHKERHIDQRIEQIDHREVYDQSVRHGA